MHETGKFRLAAALLTALCAGALSVWAGAEHLTCHQVSLLHRLAGAEGVPCQASEPRALRHAGELARPPLELPGQAATLPGGIPKVVHQVALCSPQAVSCDERASREVSPETFGWMRSWNTHHPGWTHTLWTDSEVRQLLRERRPEALPLYDSYPHAVMRADFARAHILWAHGGVYADLDFEALASLEPFLRDEGLALLESPYKKWEVVQNSLMASRAGHPFWELLFQLMEERGLWELHVQVDVLKTTGPSLLSDAAQRYFGGSVGGSSAHVATGGGSPLRQLSAEQFMFGHAGAGGAGVAVHHYAHTWDTEDTRDDIRRGAALVFCAGALSLAAVLAPQRRPTVPPKCLAQPLATMQPAEPAVLPAKRPLP